LAWRITVPTPQPPSAAGDQDSGLGGDGEGKATSIVIAKIDICGGQCDLFIWPFPFDDQYWPGSDLRAASVDFDDYLTAELPQKFCSC
jgi:hypothetical protein